MNKIEIKKIENNVKTELIKKGYDLIGLNLTLVEESVRETVKNLTILVVSNRICCKNCKALHIFPSGKYRCEKNYIEIKEDIEIHKCNYFSDNCLIALDDCLNELNELNKY